MVGFWRILEGKMEPSWHQNRSKIDANCEVRFFEKSCSRCSGGSIFEILGVEVGSKNRLKIDQKMKSTREGILASIFDRFWWILGAKLGAKIEIAFAFMLAQCWCQYGAILRHLRPKTCTGWAGGITRSAKNLKPIPDKIFREKVSDIQPA